MGYPFTENAYFNEIEFKKAVKIAVKALDTVLDENMENHALAEQKNMAHNYRNIGLGIMGLHDFLIKLGIVYGSKESKKIINRVMNVMFRTAVIASADLAREKGPFPKYKDCVLDSKIIKNHFSNSELEEFGIAQNGLRNCSLLSIAPSGSIGTMLNISTGCEPAFQISYQRKTESLIGEDKYYDVYIKIAQEYMDMFHTKKLPNTFITAGEIDWKDRVDIQSILQRHIDTAISSTVNLKNDISLSEVENLYLYAWEKGLKGVTIYRDGCKRSGILSSGDTERTETKEEQNTELKRGMIIVADDNCVGRKRTLRTGCGTLHCEAFFDAETGELLETYLSKGSSGGCANFMCGLSRMMSLAARGGIDIYSIVDQLQSSGTCPSYAVRAATKHDTSKGSSCPVAVGNALIDMYEELQRELFDEPCEEKPVARKKQKAKKEAPKCPQCGGNLVFEGGCNTCKDCGWSKCD